MEVLALSDVVKRFGDRAVVGGVSLDVGEGEVVGLIGPDGAGKTTTMRLAAGLSTPSSGTVTILGEALDDDDGHAGLFAAFRRGRTVRGRLGYMPQSFSLYSDLSVQENLRFFGGMYGVRKAVMREREKRLLGIARLEDFRDRPAGALSGGMYKKLALSCALIHEPRLLLLDEPTNGVDPISRRELWAFLKEQVGGGVGVLYSTPYMDEAARCDRVGLLVEGHLVALDTPAALTARFDATVFEIVLVAGPGAGSEGAAAPVAGDGAAGASSATTPAEPEERPGHRRGPSVPAALLAAPGVDEVYTVGRKLHVVTRRGPAFRDAIEAALASVGAHAASVEVVPPTFEDVFLHLTAHVDEAAGDADGGAHGH